MNILKYTNNTIEEMVNQGIYSIEHISKPNIFYIGQAKVLPFAKRHKSGFWGRWSKHLSDLNRKTHHSEYLQNVVNKYGIDNLKFKILEIVENIEEVNYKETWWINLLNSYKNGYNCNLGGNQSLIISEKTREKMSLNSWTRGKKGFDNHLSIPIYQYDLEGNFIKQWGSMNLAQNTLNLSSGGIYQALQGIRCQQFKNFRWFYNYMGEKIEPLEKWHKTHISVYQYSLDNIFIQKFSSVTKAAKAVNTSTTNISGACKDKRKCKGYLWKYKQITNIEDNEGITTDNL